MSIIDTVKNKICKIGGRFCFSFTKNRTVPMFFMFFLLLVLIITFGCIKDPVVEKAEDMQRQSQAYYKQAVKIYQNLISRGQDVNRLRLQLGLLYFDHGDFKQAAEEFKRTNQDEAKKYLAISYYRLGSLTDAFEVFEKNPANDDESRYYWGLTAEKLNLFDQALDIYRKIKAKEFLAVSMDRVNLIEKKANLKNIKEISPEDYKIIAQCPSQKEYPQAGALVLLSDEKIEITPANTQVSEMRYLVKILNERGKEEFSESHIAYDTTYEKIELVYARTIKPDGSVVDVGSRHIRDVSRYMNFPLYSNAHVYIISFPEITAGAVIDYKVKVYRNQLVNKKDFVLSYPVQEKEPIISAGFSLGLPKDKPLHIKMLNEKYNDFAAKLSPNISEKDGRVIYSWQFKNIPQIMPESGMPPQVEINPTIILSSFNTWDEIYKWWWGLTRDKIKADTAIQNKVQELIKDKDSDEAKVRAIHNFCAKDIRYVAVEYGQAGYEPHQAADIFRNKYGDCKDQAVLLVTMLKVAGFKAWPVLIPTKEYYNLDENFPSMLFNHAIAAVSLADRMIFMDPTAETCSFDDLPSGDQKRRVLVVKDEAYQIENTVLYPAEHNFLRQTLTINVNRDEGIDAQRKVFAYGIYDQAQRYWLLYTPPELIGETLKEKIQGISIGAKLKDYKIKNLNNLNEPVFLEYDFSGPEYFINAGLLRIFPQLGSLDTTLIAKDKRKYPLDFDVLDKKEVNFEIAIPDGFVVKYIPQDIKEDSPWLQFSAQYRIEGNRIYYQQGAQLKVDVITEADYHEFKVFFEKLAKQIKQRVILEEKK